MTAETIGKENFGKSAGSLSVIPLYLQGKLGKLYTIRQIHQNFPTYGGI